MKAILFTFALFLFHHRVSHGKSIFNDQNEEERIVSKVKQSLIEERNCMNHQEPRNYDSVSAHDQDSASENVLGNGRNFKKDESMKKWLKSKLKSFDNWRMARQTEGMAMKARKKFDDLPEIDKLRKRAFPQSFESLFARKAPGNEIEKAESEKKRREEDLLKIVEDLGELDVFNIGRKRATDKLNDDERPPRPG